MSPWHCRVLAALCLLVAARATGQELPPRSYAPNTADEDWTFLKAAPKIDIWDPVKYISLGHDDWSLTLSGEARLRPEGFRVLEDQGPSTVKDSYLLQRYMFGADVRFGPRVRVFVETQTGIITGSVRSPRPTDKDPFDLHQGFVELHQTVRTTDRLGLIVGRQEIEIGSSRLISASPGLNVKRSFDGVVLSYRTPGWTFVSAVASLVDLNTGVLDDHRANDQDFWGVSAVHRGPALERSQLGAYYLGFDARQSFFAQGHGPELRQTIGAKYKGRGARIDLNYDVLFQWGTFSNAPIRAWAVATETGWRFASLPWTPRVSVRSDIASGDRDARDPALQSFNPLFPGNSYSGAIGLVGPTNLTDLTPSFGVMPRHTLLVSFEAPSYWRTSLGDGVYATDLRVLVGPDAGAGKYVGTNPGVYVVWDITRHIELQGVVTRFISGGFLDRTFIAKGFGFYSFTTKYRF